MSRPYSVLQLLPELGFQRALPNSPHGWEYRHEGMDLSVVEGVDRWFHPSLAFIGAANDTRTMQLIEFDLPLDTESREQALALLGYHLRSTRFREPPAWLSEALELEDHLPWIAERRAYEARERCRIERDWARLPLKKLRSLADEAQPDDSAIFVFDGDVLRIKAAGDLIAVPASGKAWTSPVMVRLASLRHLPKRLMNPVVSVDLWKGDLRVMGFRTIATFLA